MKNFKREVTISGYTKMTEYYDEPFSMTYQGSDSAIEVINLLKRAFPDIVIEEIDEKVL